MVSKNNPLRDSRHLVKYFPYVDFVRQPLSTDIRHPKTGRIYSTPFFWRVKNKPDGESPDTGTEGELWYLKDITSNVANWVLLTSDGTVLSFETDDGSPNVVPDVAGEVQIFGGVGIDVTGQGAGNTITITNTGEETNFTWQEVAIATQTVVNNGYIVNNAGNLSMTLPATAVLGDIVCFIQKGAGTITIAQNAGQTIHTILGDTTTGVGGKMDTVDRWSSFCLICVTDDTDFALERGSHGSLLIV